MACNGEALLVNELRVTAPTQNAQRLHRLLSAVGAPVSELSALLA